MKTNLQIAEENLELLTHYTEKDFNEYDLRKECKVHLEKCKAEFEVREHHTIEDNGLESSRIYRQCREAIELYKAGGIE